MASTGVPRGRAQRASRDLRVSRLEVLLQFADTRAGSKRDDEYLRSLSTRERARSERFARPDMAACYVRAHGMLREMLARRLDTRPEEIRFERTPRGRPELAGEHLCRFSLSHCPDRALIAITDEVAVGVDVESHREMSERLISRVLPKWCPAPNGYEEQQRLGLEMWTCTEAALKSCGRGISGLGLLELLPHPDAHVYRFQFSGPEEARGVVIALALCPNHVGALAVQGLDVPQYSFAA